MHCWRRVEDAKGTRSVAAMGPQQSDLKLNSWEASLWISFGRLFFYHHLIISSHFLLSRSTELSREFSLEHLRHPAAPRFFADALPGLPCAGQRGHAVMTPYPAVTSRPTGFNFGFNFGFNSPCEAYKKIVLEPPARIINQMNVSACSLLLTPYSLPLLAPGLLQ